MELKFTDITIACGTLQRSNRTFMELKFISIIHKDIRTKVLIAPLWN